MTDSMRNFTHICVTRRIMIPLATCLLLGVASCGHAGRGSDGEYGYVDSESLALESIAQAEEPEEKDPHSNGLTFADGDAQMEYMMQSPDWDRYSAGILPDMVHDAPKYSARILSNVHDGFIIVDKAKMKVFFYDRFGRERNSFNMACGKNYGTKHKKGDSRTPEGVFSVEGVYNSTDWLYTDDDGVVSEKKGQFGPRFIRFKGVGSIGIHGTCAPWSIGGRRSHGCIRLTNEDIMTLSEQVEPGMVIIVSPGSRDMQVNAREDCYRPAVVTTPGGEKASEHISVKPAAVESVHVSAPDTVSVTVEPDTVSYF